MMIDAVTSRSKSGPAAARANGGPLSGIRVLDLTSVMMGPFATQILGDLGADVICIESAGGEPARYFGIPVHPQLCGTTLNVLRNKRNVNLDLKNSGGRQAFLDIAATCDIFVTNLRPGPRKRLGISYEDVRAVRPDIIYCHAQGWASESERAEDAAYDDVIQASCGMSDLLLRQTGKPAVSPLAIADQISGLTIVYSVLAALRHRDQTGQGQRVEVPMLDTMSAFVLAMHGHDAIPQPALGPPGYQRVISPLRAPLPTKDGHLQVVLYTKDQWVALLTAGGVVGAADDPRLTSPVTRNNHYSSLYKEMADVLKTRTSAEWVGWCKENGIANSAVISLDDLVDVCPVSEHPIGGRYKQIPIPVKFSETPGSIRREAPLPGQHNAEILAEVGYTPEQIQELSSSGALISTEQRQK